MERRRFLAVATGGGAGILLSYAFYRYLSAGTNVGRISVKDFLGDGPEAALRAITPAGDFYVMSSHGEPAVDVGKWRLVIGGLVEQPLRLDYNEIRELPLYAGATGYHTITVEVS